MNDASSSWIGAPSFALIRGKEEDRFTFYLQQLLESDWVRDRFLIEVCKIAAPPTSLKPRAQFCVPGGRPDLCLFGGDAMLLFEAKLFAPLRREQLLSYASAVRQFQRLNLGSVAGLFLVVPQYRRSAIESDVRQFLTQEPIEPPVSPLVVTWEAIAGLFSELAEEARDDTRLSVHLGDFSELVQEYLADPWTNPITFEEVTLMNDSKPIASMLLRCLALTDSMQSRLADAGLLISPYTAWNRADRNCGYGFSLAVPDATDAWVGVWLEGWERDGTTPVFLWLRNPDHGLVDRLKRLELDPREYRPGRGRHSDFMVAIHLDPEVDHESQVERVLTKFITPLNPKRRGREP